MKHKRTKANRAGPKPPRRVVIEHHPADAGWAARVLPMCAVLLEYGCEVGLLIAGQRKLGKLAYLYAENSAEIASG